jgi:hypothetical protein
MGSRFSQMWLWRVVSIFLDVTPCSLVEIPWSFGRKYCFHLKSSRVCHLLLSGYLLGYSSPLATGMSRSGLAWLGSRWLGTARWRHRSDCPHYNIFLHNGSFSAKLCGISSQKVIIFQFFVYSTDTMGKELPRWSGYATGRRTEYWGHQQLTARRMLEAGAAWTLALLLRASEVGSTVLHQ